VHICYLCDEYPPGPHGGVGSVTQTLARALVQRGHQATVIGCGSVGREVEEADRGVRVLRIAPTRLRGGGLLLNGWRIRQTLQRVHEASPVTVLEGPENSLAVLPKDLPFPSIIRMNGGHHFFSVTLGGRPRLKRSWIERRSFARADHLCAVSQFVAKTTLDLLGQTSRRVEILPNMVDVSLFAPGVEDSRDAVDGRDRAIEGLIVFAGTLCEKKGIRQLVQAMPSIVSAVPHARLWVLGRDSRHRQTGGSYLDCLRAQIPAHLHGHVTFKGPIDHASMPRMLAQASVCVYPSHMEALPLAWLEGMAMRKAVVGSRTGPGPEVIGDGESGLLCDPHDPESIAEQVVRLLKDADLRRRLGQNARRRAVEEFSEAALISRNEAFYRACA
jgi:glycosyltransferase involved in cell wall biosynthesis